MRLERIRNKAVYQKKENGAAPAFLRFFDVFLANTDDFVHHRSRGTGLGFDGSITVGRELDGNSDD